MEMLQRWHPLFQDTEHIQIFSRSVFKILLADARELQVNSIAIR